MFKDHFLPRLLGTNYLVFLLSKFKLFQNPAICDQNFELVLAAMYKLLGKTEQHFRG